LSGGEHPSCKNNKKVRGLGKAGNGVPFMANGRILCLGKSVYDMLLTDVPLDFMQQDGAFFRSLSVATGGDALNAAVDFARMGETVALCSMVGDDHFGRVVLERLAAEGVNTQHVQVTKKAQTSVSSLLVDPQGEVHYINVPGCTDLITAKDVPDGVLAGFSHLHFCSIFNLENLVGEELAGVFARAKAKGMTVSMDAKRTHPEKMRMENLTPALPYCDIFMPSHDEIEKIAGTDDTEVLKALFRPYGLACFGVKMGPGGLFVTDFETDVTVPSFAERVVDTTGAGDACVAAFVAGWLRGYDMRQCAALAMAQSSRVVAAVGANTGAESFEKICEIAEGRGYKMD
jgi:sugar/nucleoside kinase (ribokinase family)